MLNQTTIIIIGIVAYIVLAPLLGGLLAGIDRKITARMQGRQGPPILQSFYDVTKLINKKTFIVNNMQHFLVFSFLIFVILTGALFFGGFDILLVFFTLTTAAMFLVIAATSANSPYSSMGAQRELAQMLAYEPMVLLAAVGLYMATGSFRVSDIVQADVSAIAYLPGVFFGFLYILTIKLRKSPFDLSTSHHAHQEMVKGISTELSGGVLALMEVAHWYENILLLGIVGLFIVNSTWWSVIIAVAVCIVAYFVEILIDNTSARVKWNLMFKSAWGITIVFGAINILVLQFIK